MMRRTLTIIVGVFLLTPCFGATIKFFTDYPNSIPADSDFFVLQRNQSYINASQGQVRGLWFTSPVFTGNGSIGGNWTVNGSMFLPLQPNLGGLGTDGSGKIVAGAAFGGNQFVLTLNGNGTNESFWGTTFFDVITNTSLFAYQFFTEKTNAVLLSTDGNGFLQPTDFTAATNNDTKISSDGTNNVLALSNNITAGISAALVSPTNSFSGNGAGLTNLTYQYKTNAVSNGALTFGAAYRTNINADITLASYTLGPNGASMYESLVILATNSDTSVHKITHPSGVFTGGAAAVSWITNGYWNMIVVDHFATLYTNAQVKN